jgi:hypothetical protein
MPVVPAQGGLKRADRPMQWRGGFSPVRGICAQAETCCPFAFFPGQRTTNS